MIEDKYIEISNILSLSYNDLSTTLKQCFLYFGIFLEDQEVEAENIVWMWMAEGFIPNGEETMEDVTEGFLNELIRRSLVQVAGTLLEKVVRCRAHDSCDLAIRKALEINFFDIYDPRKHSISSSCTRHVIHGQGKRYLSLDLSNLKLRSVMFFDRDFNITPIKLHSVFRHLYVLYLDIGGRIIPDVIGSLYHLKFLRLRGDFHALPSSIGNLKNLQTLSAHAFSIQLPPETADLINLRRLVVPYLKPLKRINKLTCLRVFKDIHQCDQWKDVDLVDLVSLQELSISTLSLHADEPFPALEFLNSCQKLQKLHLQGRIEKLPLFPNSITMMLLQYSALTEDPMPILGRLPNLRNLCMYRAYEGTEIMCSDNSFSQ